MAKVKRLLPIVILACTTLVLFVVAPLALAQDETETRYVVNMTGVDQSRYVIDRSGVDDSRYVINTEVIEIGLRGVVVYPVSVDFGLLRANDVKSSDSVFTVYNAGSTALNVTIGVTGDWQGATGSWTHSDECEVGENTAGLRAIVEDGTDTTSIIVKKTAPYNRLVTNLEAGGTVSFALEIYAPTAMNSNCHKYNGIFIAIDE